jgi:hypothetical protein
MTWCTLVGGVFGFFDGSALNPVLPPATISITLFFSKRGECKEARRGRVPLSQRHASTTRTCERERDHDDDGVPPHDVE